MATQVVVDNGNGVLEPFIIGQKKAVAEQKKKASNNGGLGMVLLSTAIAVSGAFEFGMCVGYTAPTQFGMMQELNLSYAEFSVFGSIITVGAMIGAITSGRVADFIGRKGAMKLSSTACIAGWLTIYLSLGAAPLDFGRFLTGYGVGVVSYVVPVYIAEIAPKDLRGALATVNQLFIVLGIAVNYTTGAFVTWRILALCGTFPCVVMLAGLMLIPESPRWLAMVGHLNEFETSLSKLRGENANISEEKTEIQDSIVLLQQLPKVTVLDLFHRRHFRLVIVGVGMMVIQQFIGINSIIFYSDHIFASAGFPPSTGSILLSILQVFVTAFGATLIDRAGRKPLLLVSALGLFTGNALIGTSFLFKEYQLAPNVVPVMAVTGVLVYIATFSIGMGAIPWVLMSELFPLNVKGIAGSLVTLVNWLGSWIISFTFNFLMLWSPYGTFYLYASVSALSIIFIVKVVPETKGRTLEEIQAFVN